jgi:uncharacterized membrane protein SpoIIM required for sporulation
VTGALKSHRFRELREDEWRRLDRILRKAETASLSALSDEDLIAMPVLYRSTLSGLQTARATSLDAALIEYLESLCERAYYFLYGVRGRTSERFVRYLVHGLPTAMRSIWKETLVAALILGLGVYVGFALVQADPDWFFTFMSSDLSDGRDPTASVEDLREAIYNEGEGGYSTFSTMLFTHNAGIALLSFAVGFALCAPTAVLLFTNGAMLGAFLAVHVDKGLGYEIGGWLSIHGVTEIGAIILAGAAGLRMGWAVGFPGGRSRLDALRDTGRKGAAVMGGVVIMLAVAGLLEGFARQLINDDEARYAVAFLTGAFWLAYFYLPRRGRSDG